MDPPLQVRQLRVLGHPLDDWSKLDSYRPPDLLAVDDWGAPPDWDAIAGLIETWQPDALVVGLPLHADGSDAVISGAARRFMRQLEGRFRLPVFGMNERLSSHAATRTGDAANRGVDAAAAREPGPLPRHPGPGGTAPVPVNSPSAETNPARVSANRTGVNGV